MTRGVWCVCGGGGRVAWTDTGPNNDDDNFQLTGQRVDEFRSRGQGPRAAVSSLFYWLSSSRTSVGCRSQFCPSYTWEATAAAVQPLRLGLSRPTHNPELAVTTSELPIGVTRSGLPKSKYREQTRTVLAEVCEAEVGSGNLETVWPSLRCQGWGAGNCWACWEACTVLCQPVKVIGLPNFSRGRATETSTWGNFET